MKSKRWSPSSVRRVVLVALSLLLLSAGYYVWQNWEAIWAWFYRPETLYLIPIGIVVAIGSALLTALIAYLLPQDHFTKPEYSFARAKERGNLVLALWWLRNLLGFGLLIAGLVMMIAPGPGIVGMLLGVTLINVPGKRRMELALLMHGNALLTLNRSRTRFGRAPLIVPAAYERLMRIRAAKKAASKG